MTETWSVATASRLFTEAENNQDMALVDMDNKLSLHWGRRVVQLIERGCPRIIAYDTVAARAKKSRRYIQDRYRMVQEYDADEIEKYSQVGVSFMIAAMSRETPQEFLDEALKHPNTILDNLLEEFPATDVEQIEYRDKSPYPVYLWGCGRRLANLPMPSQERIRNWMNCIVSEFIMCGVTE